MSGNNRAVATSVQIVEAGRTSNLPPQVKFGATARAYTMAAALVAIWIVFEYTTHGVFLNARNFSNLTRQMAVTGVLSVGMLMVIVIGEIDLSVGSLVGLTGMAAALVQANNAWGVTATLTIALVFGLIIGCAQGILTSYARVPSFIVTLGGLLAWRGVTKAISAGQTIPIQLYNFNSIGQSYLDKPIGWAFAALAVVAIIVTQLRWQSSRKRLGLSTLSSTQLALRIGIPSVLSVALVAMLNAYEGIPVPVLLFLIVALAGAFVMSNTTWGRYMYAVGGNREAARLSGINTRALTIATFGVLGLLAGLAGVIYTARVGSASPDAGLLLELDAIAACVIGGASLMGGRGTIAGACMGALFMASLDNGMSLKNVPDFTQDIVKGTILVAAVALDMLSRKRNG
ncbi:xylose ABC transporter membrane protein [Candidatus Koribacter versatilis Ellin345]|uniref:Xylose transport system permease protein XylH n=1 Tax=Koribacter versatilis (strain Ellin345) TaxID=204669 RepID=Q1IT92_KORVE|nr:sugar ABC transporter permease [Candidatus Koribacter versatilis]ABF39908.1 xylose ABC transporter membrane protein [Candidatus Koribacter versatilis Ellin345]